MEISRGMSRPRSDRFSSLPPPDRDIAGVITLDQVRPQPRHQNEYVDTPRTPLTQPHKAGITNPLLGGGSVAWERALLPSRSANTHPIISTQPISTSPPLKKDLSSLPLEVTDDSNSIICGRCGLCRCGACTNPRELPSKWLCGDKVKMSAETAMQYCTCMWCVRGLFYHCSKEDQDSDYECVAEPCVCCNRPHCCKHWTCILMMSVCLPCLCLYLPAKGGLMACTSCYNKCRKKGCTYSCNTTGKSGWLSSWLSEWRFEEIGFVVAVSWIIDRIRSRGFVFNE